MSEPKVVWSHVADRLAADAFDEAPDDGWSLGLWLPVERDKDGAVSVKVGDLTVRYLGNDQKMAIPFVAHPDDSSNANNVHRLARALIEAADRAVSGESKP